MLTEVIKRKGGFKSAYGCVFREKVLLSRQREFNYTKKDSLIFHKHDCDVKGNL
mgnify:FL=1